MSKGKEIDSCLKFNKNSWHYKMVEYLHGKWYFPDERYTTKRLSLCKYFWTVVTGIFLYPFINLWRNLPDTITDHEDMFRAISLWAVMCSVAHIILWLIYPELWWLGITIFSAGVGAGFGVAGLVGLIFYIGDKLRERRKEKAKPNLLKEFIKAKKNKVCPCIEFVEDENES